jgi:inosine/guanosine/xanthosine phosphorylase family protein
MTGPQPVGEGVRVGETAAFLRRELGQRVERLRVALVLGSGLKGFAGGLQDRIELPFDAVPHWPAPKVAGHGRSLAVGRIGRVEVACLTGRVHQYEGWTPGEVVRAVRTLRVMGISTFLLTNAAGGIRDDLGAGQLMVISDHLNLTGGSPLSGPEDEVLGPRFPDQSAVYDPGLQDVLCALRPGVTRGVYAGLTGPAYETPAEIRMLKTLGADSVGMSTVHEATALNAMGAKVAGLSLIANRAAGLGGERLSHAEVIAAGQQATSLLTALVAAFCERVGA